jgi:hypothetical protein
MQQQLIAGDSLNFTTSAPDYPASQGWLLRYRLIPRGTGAPIEFNALAEGDIYRVQQPASATTNWAAGEYSWAAWVEKGAEKYTVDQGQITIRPDPRTVTAGYDGRSVAQKALEDAKAAFAAFTASNGTKRKYRIGEREMEFRSTEEIIQQIHYWEGQVRVEEQADRLAKGLRPKNKILTRFTRPS